MRRGEIRTLKWSYIDKNRKLIRLPAEVTKEGREKIIPINHHVQKTLDALPRALKYDYIITYKGEPIKQAGGLHRFFRSACNKAKIPHGRKTENGITIHDIRRTVKTNMLYAGVDKVHRDVIMGHSLEGMDAHYLSLNEDALTMAMGKYTSWFDDQVKSTNVDQSVDQIIKKK